MQDNYQNNKGAKLVKSTTNQITKNSIIKSIESMSLTNTQSPSI